MDFTPFDTRHYPTLPPRQGYAEWAATYDDSVLDLMDLRLLERIDSIPWPRLRRAADLACGTGRTAAWLRSRRVPAIDGVDITPEMLDRARERAQHDALHLADIRATPLAAAAYDLVICSLADEHLPDLRPLYTEAARLLAAPADEHPTHFVLLGYHPFAALAGMPTHFHRPSGEAVAIQTFVHLFSDHVAAARAAGFTLTELHESLVDDAWIATRPKWADRRGRPISFAAVWNGVRPVPGS
jgi:SAM-dependent methyltransferase